MKQKDCGRVPAMTAMLPKPKKKKSRISTGFKALKGQFPSFILLRIGDKRSEEPQFCGGTLLWNNIVLTAAHCLDHVNWIDVAATTYSVKRWEKMGVKPTKVKKFCKPQGYYKDRVDNSSVIHKDFAILVLEEPLTLDNYTQTACLPDAPIKASETGYSVGLGLEGFNFFSDDLQGIAEARTECLPALRQTGILCVQSNDDNYQGGACFGKFRSYKQELVAAPTSNSNVLIVGDSGGPFYITRKNRVQVTGITSVSRTICFSETPLISGITDVYHHLDQIRHLASECLREANSSSRK